LESKTFLERKVLAGAGQSPAPISFNLNLWGVVKFHTGGDSPRTSPEGDAEQVKFLYRRLQSGWKKKAGFRAPICGDESFFLSPTQEGVYL
jgi:hypothetical protein